MTENSLRKALEKMGGGPAAVEAGDGAPGHGYRGHSAPRGRSAQQVGRRRRFSGDDTVVVEHQSLGRP
ncbi:MAG: hypothetical protein M3030_08970, partial [Bombella apis]|nr:hypothetical protein [Bombella apis]